MKNFTKWLSYLASFIAGCAPFAANAQTPDFSGTWVGKAICSIGPVEFSMEIQGQEAKLTYDGYGPQKLYAASLPMKVTYRPSDMNVFFAGYGKGADFGSSAGTLAADGNIKNLMGLKVNGQYCGTSTLTRKATLDQAAKAPAFNAKGLEHENLVTLLMQGRFAVINTSAASSMFNALYGSYLNAYAQQCAANPKTRPKEFVEMTNLQCVQQGITTTYYRNGTFSESAPYCTRWKDVPSGMFADPKMWEVKKKLDAAFLGDTYKHLFAATKGLGLGLGVGAAVMPNVKQIAEAAMARAKDMKALIEMNGCDSPGLMRFQENLRLYAMNRPFGIRPDGSTEPPIPIPAPGTKFEDPNYVALLEELIKSEAPSWQINKYVLKSIASPTITSRDDLGRPLDMRANYRFGGMDSVRTGSMRVTFIEGYPECLYFWDKPDSCRAPDKMVVSQYVHGVFSLQNVAAAAQDEVKKEDPLILQKRREAREEARRKSRNNPG